MKEQTTLPLRHEFSDEELDDMRDNLAHLIGEQTKVELDKKESTKAFNDELKNIKGKCKIVARHIEDKFTTRDIAVEVHYNHPQRDKKTITRKDTWESWVEDMTQADWTLFTQGGNEEE